MVSRAIGCSFGWGVLLDVIVVVLVLVFMWLCYMLMRLYRVLFSLVVEGVGFGRSYSPGHLTAWGWVSAAVVKLWEGFLSASFLLQIHVYLQLPKLFRPPHHHKRVAVCRFLRI